MGGGGHVCLIGCTTITRARIFVQRKVLYVGCLQVSCLWAHTHTHVRTCVCCVGGGVCGGGGGGGRVCVFDWMYNHHAYRSTCTESCISLHVHISVHACAH